MLSFLRPIVCSVVVSEELMVPLPANLSYEAATTTPTVYATVITAFQLTSAVNAASRLGMGPGTRMLVHAGAGGIGLAATQVARALGSSVSGECLAGSLLLAALPFLTLPVCLVQLRPAAPASAPTCVAWAWAPTRTHEAAPLPMWWGLSAGPSMWFSTL